MWGTAKIYFRIEYEIVTKMEKCFRKKKTKTQRQLSTSE